MTWRAERIVVTAVLTGLVGGLVVLSLGLSPVARLAPLAVGLPTFCLLCLELASDFLRATPAAGSAVRSAEDPTAAGRMFGWLGFLLACPFLVGLAPGLSLFVLAFLRIRSRERWPVAVGFAAGMWLLLDVGLERLLRINLYHGLLGAWIG